MKSSSPKGILSLVITTNGSCCGPLTEEDFLEAVEKIATTPPRPPHVHVVSASAQGWTRCVSCGAVVWVQGSSQQTASSGAR